MGIFTFAQFSGCVRAYLANQAPCGRGFREIGSILWLIPTHTSQRSVPADSPDTWPSARLSLRPSCVVWFAQPD